MSKRNARKDEAERLVGEHYADILRYCRRHAPAGCAEDAAQETFLRFVRARSRYRERGRSRAYLVTIARNVCIDMMHDRATTWTELPEALPDKGNPEEGDERQDLASALDRLPHTQREALELRYGEGLAVSEVDRALGMSRFAAARTISSALETLRADLAASSDMPGGMG